MNAHFARCNVSVLLVAALVLGLCPQWVAAKSLTFGTPAKAGTVRVAIYGATGDKDDATTGAFDVTITAGMTAVQKATAVYNALHSHLANSQLIYAHSRSGATVTATTAIGGSEVWTVVSDNTEEGDISSCSAGDHLYYTCSAPASGVSWDGITPASITVGTSVYAATVLTTPGQAPGAVLTAARNALIANGVTNVTVSAYANGTARLHIIAGAGDTFFSFGSTDSGAGENVTLSSVAVLPGASPLGLMVLLVALAVSGAGFLARRGAAVSANA